LTAAPLIGQNITLIDSTNVVLGNGFDTVTGDTTPLTRAVEGDHAILTYGGINYEYSLTYSGTNDVKLLWIIPEPATIALLGLGLIAIRRNKK
jgi:hypothetical protein